MLHAPFVVPITTGKLDISRLLGPSPSPPAPSTRAAPSSRSISVPTSTPMFPVMTSPSPSTTSQVSSATAPANLYPPPERRAHEPSASAAAPLAPTAPLSAVNKRPPPSNPHPSASPAKKQSKWTPAEDAEIIHLRGLGMKWDDVSKHLPGRSSISCRLHYQNYLEKRNEWDEEKKNRFARLYERLKPDMWSSIARELGVPWRAAESMHWQMGEQEMARRIGVTPFSMAAASGQSSSSTTPHPPGGNAPLGAPAHSPGRTRGGGRTRGSLGGPAGGDLPPIQESLARSGESGWRDERGPQRRTEGGRGRGARVLPSVAELEGGVGVYDQEDDDEEEEEVDEEEGQEPQEPEESERRWRREG